MSVHIGQMTSEVVAPEAPPPERVGAADTTERDRRAAHRAREERLSEDRARTAAEGFDD